MTQFMIDMMAMMMPYMKPIVYVGSAAVLIALVLGLVRSHGLTGVQVLATRIAIGVGVFFIACEIAGRFLSMQPTLLFASDPFNRTMYRNQWPFWCIGLAFLAAGLVLQMALRPAASETRA